VSAGASIVGDLVSLAAWKKRKAEEAHKKELEEIQALRVEISELIDELGGVEIGPYTSEEERDLWSKLGMDTAVQTMLSTLDGYSSWPIDSSDL
jgi:hypothetical protein